jgi:hypothetical protein
MTESIRQNLVFTATNGNYESRFSLVVFLAGRGGDGSCFPENPTRGVLLKNHPTANDQRRWMDDGDVFVLAKYNQPAPLLQ